MEFSNRPGVYVIEHEGRIAYVGSSVNVRRRRSQHLNRLRAGKHANFLLQRIWDKHGEGCLHFRLAEIDASLPLHVNEQRAIDDLGPWCNLSSARGAHEHDDDAKAKMRAYALKRSADHAAKIEAAGRARRGVPNGRAGVATGRVPRSAFKPGMTPWNKKYTDEELAEKRREWNRVNGRRHAERHADERREYQRLKAREYRARKRAEA